MKTRHKRKSARWTVALLLAVAARASSQSANDSLALERARLEVKRGEEAIARTSFLRRLIPRVTFTASFGVRDVFFTEREVFPFPFPKDAYRLTLSLSLSDLLDGKERDEATLALERSRLDYAALLAKQEDLRSAREARLRLAAVEISSAEEELRLTERLAAYQKLLFDRGEVKFDVLVRAELQAVAARLRCNVIRFNSTGEDR